MIEEAKSIDPIYQILIAVLSTGGSGAAVIHLVREWLKSRRGVAMDVGFQAITAVWHQLQSLSLAIAAERIMILKSENGGGLPAPGSVIQSSCIFETFSKALPSVCGSWQKVVLDAAYSEALTMISARDNGWYWKQSSELPEDCALRTLTGEGVLIGMARICKTKSALWYLAVNFADKPEVSQKTRNKIIASLYQLRTLFERHHTIITREAQ
jgi:hypothetical protein